ncbi:mucin-2-like [Ochlerotatus camptorhynchus]|uniref:mucin-2-like n=1 Tax=Ochlerotatus camptorhynchus TaxID=644619 RepID=UPI0031E00488
MKKRAKLTMSSLALTLLCCCTCMLALANGLPITSKPLDNSPDHLTWDVGIGGKAKKKSDRSIFIAPQITGFNNSLCPPNSKLDYDGKCIQIVHINPADILVTKLQSILGSNASPNTDMDTDYDYYDSAGPFQVNLPLSIDLPVEQFNQQLIPEESFYDSTVVDISSNTRADSLKQASTVKDEQQSTFLTESSRQPMDQTAAESHTDISFLSFESLPNGSLSTRLELDSNKGTVVQKIVLSSTPATPTTTTVDTIDAESVELSRTSTVASDVADATTTGSSTAVEELSTSTVDGSSAPSTTTSISTTEEYLASESSVATTTQMKINETSDEDIDNLKAELADESFILEPTGSTTTDFPSTDMSDFEVDVAMLSAGSTIPADRTTTVGISEAPTSAETTTARMSIHTIPPTYTRKTWSSPKPVQIVTPLKTKWYSPPGATPPPFIVASYTQQERTTRASPETTTVPQRRNTEAPLLVINDTEDDKKNRDNIHRQEMKDTLRESMDTNNRFVYHHLPASHVAVSTPPSATTAQSHNYVDQLKIINEIVAENKQRHEQTASSNSRIRFPTRDDDQLPAASSSGGMIRFPGSVSNRVTQHANRIPDIFPKKTPDSTTQRPPFWWLPSGWEVDQTGQKPMLLRFWSRMPLVRDQSLTTTSTNSNSNRWRPSPSASGSTSPSSVSPRGNSRSPSENFYKEVSSQDVYKVLNARQLKHKR